VSLKKYYNRLGLSETASSEDVRRQFRKLAMKYHPDKNPSEDAQDEFLKITEAYEILTGKKKIQNPLGSRTSGSNRAAQKERVREARKRYYEQIIKEQKETEIYFNALLKSRGWKVISISAVVGIILSVSLLFDFFLPNHYSNDRLTHYALDVYSSVQSNEKRVSLVMTDKNDQYWIEQLDFPFFGQYRDFRVQKTWIFHDPVQLISVQDGKVVLYPVEYTFFSFAHLIIPIFLLPAFTMYYKRKTITFTILYYLSIYLSTGLILLFLFLDKHLLHLVTFGFW
jgi:curved DNA-binding protein CbpA